MTFINTSIPPPEPPTEEDLLAAIDKSPELKSLVIQAEFAWWHNDFTRANALIDEATILWKELEEKEK